MKAITVCVLCSALAGVGLAIPACQTSQPGVKSSYRSQWTTVNATTTKTTEIAKDVLEDLKLKNIESTATEVDGNVHGYTADNTKVTVEVERVTDKTSQVSVYVGAMGDPDLGKEILARIQEETR